MSWFLLLLAGLFEVVWAMGLKYSHGLTKPLPAAITIIFMILSVYLLAVATRQIPIGIAYTVWVGIGAIGAFIGSIVLFDMRASFLQILFFSLILIGLIGLKLASNHWN